MPARGETRARSPPSRALNSRLLPAFGGPTRTTRGCPRAGRGRGAGRPGRRARRRPSASSRRARRGRAGRRRARRRSRGSPRGGRGRRAGGRGAPAIGPARPPASCSRAASSCAGVRGVDHAEHRLGPGQVDPAREEGAERELARLGVPRPAARQWARTSSSRGGEPTVWISASGWPGVGPRARPERERRRQAAAAGRRPAAAPRGARRGAGGGPVDRRARSPPARSARRLGPGQPDEPAEARARGAGDRGDRVGRVERASTVGARPSSRSLSFASRPGARACLGRGRAGLPRSRSLRSVVASLPSRSSTSLR